MKIGIKLHNRFDFELKDAKTGEVKQTAYAENIILNNAFAVMGAADSGGIWAAYIQVGSGTGTLDPARTTLFSVLGGYDTTAEDIDVSHKLDGYVSRRRYIVLNELALVGETIREVGFGKNSTTSLTTHALLKDMNGNTVAITKTETDILTIYGTIYCYFPADGWDNGNISLFLADDGYLMDNDLLVWLTGYQRNPASPYLAFANSPHYGPNMSSVQGGSYFQAAVTPSWSSANKKVTVSYRLPVGSGNMPIRAVYFEKYSATGSGRHNLISCRLHDSSAHSGSQVTGESIGVGDGSNQDFKTAYGMVKSGAKVYVDSVEKTSGVTVKLDQPVENVMDYVLKIISKTYRHLSPQCSDNSGYCYAADNHELVFENPLYATIGLDSCYIAYGNLYSSDDAETWTLAIEAYNLVGATQTIPSAQRNKRYWKYNKPTNATGNVVYLHTFASDDIGANAYNVHFDVAPALDEVITMDYVSKDLIKTSDYVVDFTFEIVIGEYVKEY